MELINRIKITNISKSFVEKKTKNKIEVLKNFSIEIPFQNESKIISIVGKSGSGKTTLLRLIAGLDNLNNGEITINGETLNNEPSKYTTLIPQKFTCFPWLNVYDNIAFGLSIKGKKNVNKIVNTIAKKLGLFNRLHAYPSELSGGMQQRVAIGRALAIDVPILLMDEPFGALDAFTRQEMQQLILDITKKQNKLFILVTHDINEAILLSNYILILPKKPTTNPKKVIKIPFKYPRLNTLIYETEFNNLKKKITNLL